MGKPVLSQCTYRCVVLPDPTIGDEGLSGLLSQCTYRCVVLPDGTTRPSSPARCCGLNAPTGAWCSLTRSFFSLRSSAARLNAPTGAWCSLTFVEEDGSHCEWRLNAPTGAWCSLTRWTQGRYPCGVESQCTYRCVVLPDPCSREWRYDATSRARSATGPGSTPPDRPAPGSD